MELIFQPFYGKSTGEFLKEQMADTDWEGLHWAVAFTKASGTKHVRDGLTDFSSRAEVKLSLGIDHKGTSYEGLFDLLTTIGPSGEVFIIHNKAHSTFHPKIYSFYNSTSAIALIGSGNLTEGGLYSNYEAATIVEYDLSDDAQSKAYAELSAVMNEWSNEADETVKKLSDKYLEELKDSGLIIVEEDTPSSSEASTSKGKEADEDKKTADFGYKIPPKAPAATSIVKRRKAKRPKPADKVVEATPEEATAVPDVVEDNVTKTYLMTLQKTDVGVGQTSKGTSRRSPEIFIPIGARNESPEFWGWPDEFTVDPTRVDGKADRLEVPFLINGDLVLVNMMTWPQKSDFRLRAEALRSIGEIGDILRVSRIEGDPLYNYTADAIVQGTPEYDEIIQICNKPIRNSKKLYNYI